MAAPHLGECASAQTFERGSEAGVWKGAGRLEESRVARKSRYDHHESVVTIAL